VKLGALLGDVSALVLAALGAVHVYWAARGAAAGSGAIPEVDGKPLFRPGRLATLGVAGALFVAAAVVLGRLGQLAGLGVPPAVFGLASWGLTAVLFARAIGDFRYVGFFKRVRGTRFARLDSAVFSPLVLALALGCAAAAWEGPQ